MRGARRKGADFSAPSLHVYLVKGKVLKYFKFSFFHHKRYAANHEQGTVIDYFFHNRCLAASKLFTINNTNGVVFTKGANSTLNIRFKFFKLMFISNQRSDITSAN